MDVTAIKLPAHIQAKLDAGELPPLSEAELAMIDNAELTKIRAQQGRNRMALLYRMIPDAYHQASVDQIPPTFRNQVREWLSGGGRTLIIVGPPGVGKTYAGSAIALDSAKLGGYTTGFMSTAEYLRGVEAESRVAREGGQVPDRIRHLAMGSIMLREDAELAVIDDLGAERATSWAVEQITELLDARVNTTGRRQVITTNASATELTDSQRRTVPYEARLMSRLMGGATVIRMTGQDRRQQW